MAEIRITSGELNDPAIDEVVNLQRSMARSGGEFIDDIPTPFYMNPVFYYAVAALLAGVLAWTITEPGMRQIEMERGGGEDLNIGAAIFSGYLFFCAPPVLIGVFLAVAYGLSNRNLRLILYAGAVSIGVGILASILTGTLAGIIFSIARNLMMAVVRANGGMHGDPHDKIHGLAFFLLICGRSAAWAVVAMASGLGLGVALKSKKLILNGLAGGLIGGMLGGLLFDPVDRFIMGWSDVAWVSRLVGVGSIGLLVGLFIGLFENMSKDAWFLMLKGPLMGKQFIIFKSPLIIGSAPKSDIYLFKDPTIEPRHASVTKSGAKYVIKDEGTPAGTFVNGKKVDRCILQPDDVVSIGETILKYHERVKR